MLDPIYNQRLRLCLGAFRTSPVESTNLVWVLDVQNYLYSTLPRLSHCLTILHMTWYFDKRPNVIRTFGLCIKQFLTASNIDFFRHFGNTFVFYVTTSVYQITEDYAGSGACLIYIFDFYFLCKYHLFSSQFIFVLGCH